MWRYHQSGDENEILKLSLQMAFTLDAIWNLRNQILHDCGQANTIAIAWIIENRF